MLSVLPPPPGGLQIPRGTYEHQQYIATGFFQEGVARNQENVVQIPGLFQDADLKDYILGYDRVLFEQVKDTESWITDEVLGSSPARKMIKLFEKDNADDIHAWAAAALDTPNGNTVVKAWLHCSEQANDTLEDMLEDQRDYIAQVLKTIGRLPQPTVVVRSGYGHHFYWWFKDGQGQKDGPHASNSAAALRVNANIAALVNKAAAFQLFDPIVARQLGHGYCREIGSRNTKGRWPREVEVLSHRPRNRIDLAALALPSTDSVAPKAPGAASSPVEAMLSGIRKLAGKSFEDLDPNTLLDFGDEQQTVAEWMEANEPGTSAKVCCPFSSSQTVGSARIYMNDAGAVFLNCWAEHHNHPHHDGRKALWIYDPNVSPALADEETRPVAELLRLNEKTGKPQPGSIYNLEIVASESPEYRGRFWWSERRMTVMIDDRPLRSSDITAFQIYCETTFDIYERSTDMIKAVFLRVAERRRRNELKEWWESVTWDGTPRLETWLIQAAGIEDTPLHRAYSRKFLVSVIARVYDPGCKLDQVLLLIGSQGAKKSTLFQKLIGAEWFSDTGMDLQNKDSYMQLYQAVIYEWSENFKGGQLAIEREKAFITSQKDTFRPPYGALVESFPRHTVIVATSNVDHPLADATGSRRWWPVQVADILDLSWIERMRDQLWAEALIEYKKHIELGAGLTGYEWWIEKGSALDMSRTTQADKYTKEDPRLDALLTFATKRKAPVTVTEVGELAFGIEVSDIKKHDASLSALLKEAGFGRLARKEIDGRKVTRWLSPFMQLPEGEKFLSAEDGARHAKHYKPPTPPARDNVVAFNRTT
jgi:hypothetical protein